MAEPGSKNIYAQAYADNLALLIAGNDTFWVRDWAQKAVNSAGKWAEKMRALV